MCTDKKQVVITHSEEETDGNGVIVWIIIGIVLIIGGLTSYRIVAKKQKKEN